MCPVLEDRAAPLVALDRVVRLDAAGIATLKAITGNEAFFPGHYPDNPVYPGVFIIEAVCQAATHFAREYHGPVQLQEVKSTRFLSPLRPGELLESECACTYSPDDQLLHVKASCRSGTGRVAEMKLSFGLERQVD